MKTKIILTIAILISITFFVYGQIKAYEAERNAVEAQEQAELTKSEIERAEKLAELAQKVAVEALEAQHEVEKLKDQLLECQNKK